MNCTTARALLLEPEAGRRSSPQKACVARHLAECESCQRVFADTQLVGEMLEPWPDLASIPEDRAACVDAMACAWAEMPRERERRFTWWTTLALKPVSIVGALAVCVLLVALWPPPQNADPVAAVHEALEGVDAWYANGTITPALVPINGQPTNKVEIWFQKPDTMLATIDGKVIQLLQEGSTRTWHFGPLNQTIIERTDALDVAGLFSVSDWLSHESVLASPTRVLGEDWFGEQRVTQIEIQVAEAHPTTARDLGISSVQLDANVDSMLPVHIEARGFARLRDRVGTLLALAAPSNAPPSDRIENRSADYLTLHLHFRYGLDAAPTPLEVYADDETTVLDRR